MKKTAATALFFIVIFSVFAVSADKWPYGFPTALTNSVDDLVPMDKLEKVALKNAEEMFTNISLRDEIPCCDIDGNILAYMFVYNVNNSRTNAEIYADIKTGRAMQPDANAEMEKETLKYRLTALKNRQDISASNSEIPVDAPESYIAAYKKVKSALQKKWGSNDFCTVVVSARSSLFPVPERITGLPDFYTKIDTMQVKAAAVLGSGPLLTRIFYITPMDTYFEFTGNGRTILINSNSGAQTSLSNLAAKINKRSTTVNQDELDAAKKKISEEWAKYE